MLLAAGGAYADTWNTGGLLTDAERAGEMRAKESRLEALMQAKGLDALVFAKWRNHAWLLAGSDTRIVRTQADSPVWLVIGRGGRKYLVGGNNEIPRIMAEEGLKGSGWIARGFPWFAGMETARDERRRVLDDVVPGAQLGSDLGLEGAVDIGPDLARARFPLTPTETRRMRWLGARSAAAVEAVCREVSPGMSETSIGGLLAAKLARDGVTPSVILVGCDERLAAWRHLTPTDARLKRLALVNLCAEKWGLVVAVSRMVHFGPLPADLSARMQACASVDATYLRASRPGATLGLVLAAGASAYAAAGWPEEWRNHHQGGPIGYFEREALAFPGSPETIVEGEALAFNPTLPGVKVEDTFLVGPRGPEVLTRTAGWPVRKVVLDGAVWERPDILVRAVPRAPR